MLQIDGNSLAIDQVVKVARQQEEVQLSDDAREQVIRARGWVDAIVAADQPVYGINTGFGIFADRRIPRKDAARLSRNLILSHAVGTGPDLPDEVVRAAMLVRANTLAKGHSGVRPEIIDTLLLMLNRRVTPVVPSQGSMGSSGDLGPLSHMAMVFTTDPFHRSEDSGWARYDGKLLDGKTAMAAAEIEQIELGPKEGLALNNGATFSVSIGALACYDVRKLLFLADLALSMSLEVMLGTSAAFDERLHQARGMQGQIHVADRVRRLTRGSSLLDSAGRVQDAYSLRCAPQVQGVAGDTLKFVEGIIGCEINAATDNPLLFDPGIALSGGNFHGEPVGIAMDFLGISLAEVGAIAERRIFRLTDGKLNGGLPPMLVDTMESAGLNSGLMMPQYTAASLVLENQTLATPDTVHSLPTSGEQEDHNANSMTAARHARSIVENVQHILAIEIYTASRAVDLRLRQTPGVKLGIGVDTAYQLVREAVPYQAGDAWWAPEIKRVSELIMTDQFVTNVENAIR